MKVIVDSGGSKADWAVTTAAGWAVYKGKGLNIAQLMDSRIPAEVLEAAHVVQELHFYGAGLFNQATKESLKEQLSTIFRQGKIYCEGDLLAACRSTAAERKAIVCILGTGSNSCTYDGIQIIDNIPALGYVVGDEGSGTAIGKEVLKAYFYREMQEGTASHFRRAYGVDKDSMLAAIKDGSTAAGYLAQFARFPNTLQGTPLIDVVRANLDEFIRRRVLSYDEYLEYPVHFVGSIAYFYSTLIKELCEQHQLQVGSIVQKPINGLIEYHK